MLQAAVLVGKNGEQKVSKNIFITGSGKTVVVNEFIHPDCGDQVDPITQKNIISRLLNRTDHCSNFSYKLRG